MKCSVQGGGVSWNLSCAGDSATVVLSLVFTVLGAKGVGRNQSPTPYYYGFVQRHAPLMVQCCEVFGPSTFHSHSQCSILLASSTVLPASMPDPGLCKLGKAV